jgi:hypothetical protein
VEIILKWLHGFSNFTISTKALIISLICSIVLVDTALPSNATVSPSSNTGLASNNMSSLNQTLTALENNLTQTLAILNDTATDQARLNEEARRNATEIITREFKDLPNSILLMMGIAIVLVIAIPVIIDLF